MKRFLFVFVSMLAAFSLASAEIDLSGLTFDDLVLLEEQIQEAKKKLSSDLSSQLPESPVLDVVVDSVRIQNNSAGTPLVFVVLKNTSQTLTIDRIDFNVKCYDAYGDLIKIYDRYGYSECFYDASALKPGAKSLSSHRWTFYGAEGVKQVEIAIIKYHATDGTTVTVPASQIEWVRF